MPSIPEFPSSAPKELPTSTDWHNLTQRLKQANEALEAQVAALGKRLEQFQAVSSKSPDHIIVQDRDLRYTLVINPQLGLTETGMLGKTDWDILSHEEAGKLTAIKRKVIETGEPFRLEVSLQNWKGQPEFFDGTYVPKSDSTGKTDGLIGYFRNVTERKCHRTFKCGH